MYYRAYSADEHHNNSPAHDLSRPSPKRFVIFLLFLGLLFGGCMVEFKKAQIDTGDSELDTGSGLIGGTDRGDDTEENTDEIPVDSDTGSAEGTDRDTDTGSGSDTGSDTDTGWGSDTDTGSGSDSDTDWDTETGSGSDTGAETDSDTGVALDDYIAFFPFNGSAVDLGPHDIALTSSTLAPAPGADREGNPDASYLFAAASGTYFFNDELSSPLSVGNELTVSVWVNLTDSSADQKIVGRAYRHSSTGKNFGWVLSVIEGKLYSEIWDENGVRFAFVEGTVPSGVWTHLAITWKTGLKFRGYIDGQAVREFDASPAAIGDIEGAVLRIGARPWSFPNFFVDGAIDDLRIYDRELTGEQIGQLRALPPD